MAQTSGVGTVWNLPNYWGDLFTADLEMTPLLAMIGGLSGGGLQTDNFEFAVAQEYDYPTAAQPAITETASLTAPDAVQAIRAQAKNVTQIFHEAVNISYAALSNKGRLSGINTAGKTANPADEKAFQIAYGLQHIARDLEYTLFNGAYQISTGAGVANKTRGLIAVPSLAGGTAVAAGSVALSKALIDQLLREMFDNGALFRAPVLWMNAFQKQALSDIYGYAPADRNFGGVNIQQIETDFGLIGIANPHRFMPTDTILCADMAVVNPVTQPVPEKGNFFYEELSKTGAAEKGQIFGQFGVDHGPAFAHGKITGLTTS